MVRFLLDALLTGAQGVVSGIAISKMLQMKQKRQFFLAYVSIALAVYLLSTSPIFPYLGYRTFASIALTCAVCLYHSRETRGKTLCAVLLVYCVMVMLELLLSSIWDLFAPIGAFEAAFGTSHLWFASVKFLYLSVCAPALAGLVWVWNRVVAKQGQNSGMAVGLALFPFGQIMLLAQVCFTQYAMGERTTNIYITCALNLSICLAADILLLREMRRLRQLHQLEQKQLLVEQHLAVQESYYRYLEERIVAVSKLRHDMSNQLQTAFSLLRQREDGIAREQLEQLQRDLTDAAPRRYSSNPIVDAVLEDKASRCRELEIALSTKLDLPYTVDIEPSALCSIFSNLLDNALHGCETCAGRRFIHCETLTQGEYVVIEVVNAKGKLSPSTTGRGLGLVILREVTAAYGGRLEVQEEESLFTATVWLCPG